MLKIKIAPDCVPANCPAGLQLILENPDDHTYRNICADIRPSPGSVFDGHRRIRIARLPANSMVAYPFILHAKHATPIKLELHNISFRDGAKTTRITTIKRKIMVTPQPQRTMTTADTYPLNKPAEACGTRAEYSSCFISHAHEDSLFTHKLYADLTSSGVTCWLAEEHLRIGDKLRTSLEAAIGKHDKFLLVLSDNSLESWWVEHEVESALVKERKHRKSTIIPIRLATQPQSLEKGWAEFLEHRLIGDFSNWQNPSSYTESIGKLLNTLIR